MLHFVVGAARAAQSKFNGDTVEHLEQAVQEYPNAHIVLAESLVRLGQAGRARIHIEASMMSSTSAIRDRAAQLMQMMETR